MASVKLVGLEGVMNTIRGLPRELKAGRIIRTAVRKGAQVVQKEAKVNVRRIIAEPNKNEEPSKSTGLLEESIIVKRTQPEGGKLGEAFLLGPFARLKYAATRLNRRLGRVGKTYDTAIGPAFYAWFLEFGTERMRAHPFVRPAYEAKKTEAIAVIVSEITKGAERALRKLQRQNKVKT